MRPKSRPCAGLPSKRSEGTSWATDVPASLLPADAWDPAGGGSPWALGAGSHPGVQPRPDCATNITLVEESEMERALDTFELPHKLAAAEQEDE